MKTILAMLLYEIRQKPARVRSLCIIEGPILIYALCVVCTYDMGCCVVKIVDANQEEKRMKTKTQRIFIVHGRCVCVCMRVLIFIIITAGLFKNIMRRRRYRVCLLACTHIHWLCAFDAERNCTRQQDSRSFGTKHVWSMVMRCSLLCSRGRMVQRVWLRTCSAICWHGESSFSNCCAHIIKSRMTTVNHRWIFWTIICMQITMFLRNSIEMTLWFVSMESDA